MYIQRVAFVYLFLARANLAIHVKTETKYPITNLYDTSNKHLLHLHGAPSKHLLNAIQIPK